MKRYFKNGLEAYSFAAELGLPLMGKEFTEMSSIEYMSHYFKERIVVGINDGGLDRDYATGSAFLQEDGILSDKNTFYVYQLCNKHRVFDLLPVEQIPFATQLRGITDDPYSAVRFKNLTGNGLNSIGHIVHIKSGAVFHIPAPTAVKVVEPS